MLSPKMQRTVRINDNQLVMLSERAHSDHSYSGYLHKKTADSGKWQLRWFVLYQNLLFYYESEALGRPSGVILLEGCYCERLINTTTSSGAKALDPEKQIQHCFAISYRKEHLRQYELRASSESDCKAWIEAIRDASFNKLLFQKEELEQKHLHLLQIVESEKTAKWQYTQQCEELASEIKKLRAELCSLKKEYRAVPTTSRSFNGACGRELGAAGPSGLSQESSELRKIKKVQSFFRGWLCRRRWKQIVEQYIKSPHAESMRKRNSLVFRMVEAEEEYMEQMEILVSCFLRPFKMAASSKKPPCTHEDVNSIFLNSETVLFLHQIFLKGLTSRMESWPTLVLGDLFDMLLPMLSIYQEYVRNHHYSLQVLTECKQSVQFVALLMRLENKPACHGRNLETFLTYPMHQVPRYIITLHELLAHTPHDHVERKSLQNARQQLEDLSRQMHDEVSETENLRKNLALERMIVEGCDILLDVNQVFVRQGSLIQLPTDKPRSRSRLVAFKVEKETLRQCFLFSNHLILATRSSGGKLHLVADIGKIPLADAMLIEDPSDLVESVQPDDDEPPPLRKPPRMRKSGWPFTEPPFHSSFHAVEQSNYSLENRDFQVVLDPKIPHQQPLVIHLVAPSLQEKSAWISDISQCMDNVHFNDLLHYSLSDTSSVTMPQYIKNDPKLFKDDVDIRFSRTLNSCKVPQIRYATPERLLERLTDLRFLSIDFLNTFLLTYRVFTDGVTVLEALKKVFYNADPPDASYPVNVRDDQMTSLQLEERRQSSIMTPRRTSGASSVSGYDSEMSDRDRSHSYDSQGFKTHWRCSHRKFTVEDEQRELELIQESAPILKKQQSSAPSTPRKVSIRIESEDDDGKHLTIPTTIAVTSSSETLTEMLAVSAPSSPSNLSTVTLVGSNNSDPSPQEDDPPPSQVQRERTNLKPSTAQASPKTSVTEKGKLKVDDKGMRRQSLKEEISKLLTTSPIASTSTSTTWVASSSLEHSKPLTPQTTPQHAHRHSISNVASLLKRVSPTRGETSRRKGSNESDWAQPSTSHGKRRASRSEESYRSRDQDEHEIPYSARASITSAVLQGYLRARGSMHDSYEGSASQRPSLQYESPQNSSKAGVIITSFRQSQRRSSTSTAAAAFAIATSASSNPRDHSPKRKGGPGDQGPSRPGGGRDLSKRKESVMSTAATMRVLNVLRHWVSKHSQDFENDQTKNLTRDFLEDIIYSPNLLPAEHKAASQLLRLISKEEPVKVDLKALTTPILIPCPESIESLSALEIAEQMTYMDHQIFIAIRSEEFLGQAWMKIDRADRAQHIILMTKRFNEISQLVVSEIVRRSTMSSRIAVIEKWAAVADIARCLHNFNGVLQVCAAFTNSSVYRLKKTWEKVSKTTKQTIDKLQNIISSDGRFRNLRDALHRCDPPCIPYLGMYLTDLSFIEEGTPNFTEDGLLNFSKMRMIAHVIREIRHFQQGTYKIELYTKVTNYLLDPTILLDDEELYRLSLEIEPRTSRLSTPALPQLPSTSGQQLRN